jgi:hypothetical protein
VTELPDDKSEAIIIARERLRFLAIGYYVRGGVIVVFSSFLLFYVVMFSAFLLFPNPSGTRLQRPRHLPPPLVGRHQRRMRLIPKLRLRTRGLLDGTIRFAAR